MLCLTYKNEFQIFQREDSSKLDMTRELQVSLTCHLHRPMRSKVPSMLCLIYKNEIQIF